MVACWLSNCRHLEGPVHTPCVVTHMHRPLMLRSHTQVARAITNCYTSQQCARTFVSSDRTTKVDASLSHSVLELSLYSVAPCCNSDKKYKNELNVIF